MIHSYFLTIVTLDCNSNTFVCSGISIIKEQILEFIKNFLLESQLFICLYFNIFEKREKVASNLLSQMCLDNQAFISPIINFASIPKRYDDGSHNDK